MGNLMHYFKTEAEAIKACSSIPSIDGDVEYVGAPPHVTATAKPYCVPIQGADGWYIPSDPHIDAHVTAPKREYRPLSE